MIPASIVPPNPRSFAFPALVPILKIPPQAPLTPDATTITLPVIPPIPPVVNTGDVITAVHENTVTTSLSDLWTDLQAINAAMLTDPTTTKGDLIVRGSGITRLPVGADGTFPVADASQALGMRWATVSAAGAVPATRQVIAGAGMTGGGPLSADVTLNANVTSVNGRTGAVVVTTADTGGVPATRRVIAGTGLAGGGALSADVTLSAVPMAASGASHAAGTVPDPGATAGATRYLREDATWAIPAGAGGGLTDPTTTKGDLMVRSASAVTRLGVGADGQALVADSSQALGVKWAAVSGSGFTDPTTTLGDLIVRGASATGRLAVGANGQVLTADSTAPNGIKWAAPTGGSGSQTPWTSDIDAAFFSLKNAGRIGAGTTTPAMPFSAVGNVSGVYSGAVIANLSSTVGSSAQLCFAMGNQGATPTALIANVLESSSGGALVFSTYNSGMAERMRITSAGNVGIGMASPNTLLEVRGGAGASLGHVNVTDGAAFAAGVGGRIALRGYYDSTNVANFALISGYKSTSTSGDFMGGMILSVLAGTGSLTEAMRIVPSGNVGINWSTPTDTLMVRPPSGRAGITIQNKTNSPTDESTLSVLHASTGYGFRARAQDVDGGFALDVQNGGTWIASAMTVKSATGNVGIGPGATTPVATLHVSATSTPANPAVSGSTDPAIQFRLYGANVGTTLDIGTNGSGVTWIQNRSAPAFGSVYPISLNPNGGKVGINVQTAINDALSIGCIVYGGNQDGGIRLQSGSSEFYCRYAIKVDGGGAPRAAIDLQGTEMLSINSNGVGVGTTAPQYKLDVSGALHCSSKGSVFATSAGSITAPAATDANILLALLSSTNWCGIGCDVNGSMWFRTGLSGTPDPRLVVSNGGGVGVAMTNPVYSFQVGSDSCAKPGTNTWTVASDLRVKRDIEPFTEGLETILKLRPIAYTYNGEDQTPEGYRSVGLIAQEVAEVVPSFIRRAPGRIAGRQTEVFGLNTGDLTWMMVNAFREINERLIRLEKL